MDMESADAQLLIDLPRLSIVADRGSDVICAVNFAQRHLGLNLDYVPDASHDHWNELREGLKEVNLWPHILIAVIAYNCDYAPWGEDAFYCQLRGSFAEYLVVGDPRTCPLWAEYWPRIWSDRGQTSRMGEANISVVLWEEVKAEWTSRATGEKIGLSRFMAAVKVASARLPEWSLRELELVYLQIASGKLTTKKYKDIAKKMAEPCVLVVAGGSGAAGSNEAAPALVDPQQPVGASVKRGNDEVGKMRRLCENKVQVATLLYLDEQNTRRQRIMVGVSDVLMSAHGIQNQRQRSVCGSLKWLVGKCVGDCSKPVIGIVKSLSDPMKLQTMRFGLQLGALESAFAEQHPFFAAADEYSELAGSLVLALLRARLKRQSWSLFGWPARLCLLCHCDPSVRSETAEAFRKDYDIHIAIQYIPGAQVQELRQRSLFLLPCVRQFKVALEANGWEPTPAMQEFARTAFSRVGGSQMSEDGASRCRRAEDNRNSKWMSDVRCWSALAKSDVIGSVHHYDVLPFKSEPCPRSLT